MAFVRTVIDFLNVPVILPVPLYVTFMLPFCPGAMGVFVYVGTVQPQLATA